MEPNPRWRRHSRLFGPDPAADVKDELQFHLECLADELVEQGWSPADARRESARRMGDLRSLQQLGRRIGERTEHRKRIREYLHDSLWDLRYTIRGLRHDPGFTAVCILILALAIGANVAVFSVVNTLLLRPLPFPEAHQLVWIAPPPGACGFSCATYSADAFEEFRSMSRVYQDVSGYEAFTTPDNLRLTGHGDPQPATSIMVVGNFFQVLGVKPAMGRLFAAEETRPGLHPVALLTDAYWRHQFAADPAIVGKAIDISGIQTTIVGVLPASFDFGAVFSPGERVDLFTPLDLDKERNWGNIMTLMGRLKPGVTIAQARDDANRVAPDIYFSVRSSDTRGRYKGDLIPTPLKGYVTGKLHRSLITLWSAVGIILLIACVNLSNLLLARASARAREFAVRGALGASRGRIVRQFLLESLVLSSVGALCGLGLAMVLLGWLAHQTSIALPLLSTQHIDSQVLGWTVLVAFVTALIFGLIPGLRIAAGNVQEVLKDSGTGTGRKHQRLRAALVITEIALACMLLVSAGLLLRSFIKVLGVDLGFEPDHAASIQVDYEESGKTAQEAGAHRMALFQRMIERVDAVPGVETSGIVDFLPLGPNREWDTPVPQGKRFAPGELPDPLVYVVTPGFVHAMGMRLHGRDFSWADRPSTERVVLINASAARIYWPGENAVGKILMRGPEADRVVGVVDDVHEESVETNASAQIYYPASQQTPDWAQLVVRTRLPPAALGASVLSALRELNPNQPAAEFRPIRTIVDHAVSPRRFFMLLVASFAALGLILATLGIYGVISYSVTQQTQEIGVRMALGAGSGRIQRDVIFRTLRFAAAGIALGTAASFLSARFLASLLFGISPWDLSVYVAMAVTLVAVALASGYLPARRASRIDPMRALRNY
jgi:predicted permease